MAIFRRGTSNGSTAVTPAETAAPEVRDPSGRKPGPTPSRKEAEAARRQRVTQTYSKKESRALASRQNRSDRMKALAARDNTPEKALMRDYVDARFSIGEILLPALVLILATELPEHDLPAGRRHRHGRHVRVRARGAGRPLLHVARLQEGARPAPAGHAAPAACSSTAPTGPSRSAGSASRRPASSAARSTERGDVVTGEWHWRVGPDRRRPRRRAQAAGRRALPDAGRGRELARGDLPRPARVRRPRRSASSRATGACTDR